jgi:hypothetical protein
MFARTHIHTHAPVIVFIRVFKRMVVKAVVRQLLLEQRVTCNVAISIKTRQNIRARLQPIATASALDATWKAPASLPVSHDTKSLPKNTFCSGWMRWGGGRGGAGEARLVNVEEPPLVIDQPGLLERWRRVKLNVTIFGCCNAPGCTLLHFHEDVPFALAVLAWRSAGQQITTYAKLCACEVAVCGTCV